MRRERSSRPFIACAVLENVELNEDRIKILMKLQENLHWALGRDRKHASIGVYDLGSLGLNLSAAGEAEGAASAPSADLEYTTEDPESFAFVPLGAPGLGVENRRTLRQILEEHPKGMDYAHLLAGFDRYPILRTRRGLVLSMPPIINSEDTKVHLGSRGFFIDVTGTIERVVQRTLNILVTSLLEMDPGVRLRTVTIENATSAGAPPSGSSEALVTPVLTPQEAWCDPEHVTRMLGFPLARDEVKALLERMRHGVEEGPGNRLRVLVPAYRNDILHEIDLVEDVAIAYGYSNVPRTLVPTQTVGRPHPLESHSEKVRDVLIGLGFIEVLNLVLTAPEQSDRLLDREDHPRTILLENPISTEQTQLRTSLIPGLLTTFARNRHNPLPQAIFEVGDVTFLDAKAETGAREVRHLAFGVIAPKVGFAEARALAEAIVREFGIPLRLRPHEPGFLLEGRGAQILATEGALGSASQGIGVFGEVHPRVLERLGLQNPTLICEMAVPLPERAVPYESMP